MNRKEKEATTRDYNSYRCIVFISNKRQIINIKKKKSFFFFRFFFIPNLLWKLFRSADAWSFFFSFVFSPIRKRSIDDTSKRIPAQDRHVSGSFCWSGGIFIGSAFFCLIFRTKRISCFELMARVERHGGEPPRKEEQICIHYVREKKREKKTEIERSRIAVAMCIGCDVVRKPSAEIMNDRIPLNLDQ